MTNEERNARLKQMIKDYTAENTVSREIAREAFWRAGIYLRDGRLRVEFGGDGIPGPDDPSSF
jgi:hypothetical protein